MLITAVSFVARSVLRRRRPTVVAVTGSVGKTTTKDLVAAVLRTRLRVWATRGTANTELAVPLTVVGWPRVLDRGRPAGETPRGYPDALVLELGAGRPGELERLTRTIRPDIAVVTAVGSAHAEHFHTLEATAAEKSWLVRRLRAGGVAVLNAGDTRVREMASAAPGRVVTYAVEGSADVALEQVSVDEHGTSGVLRVRADDGDAVHPFRTQLLGSHQLGAVAAAVAVGLAMGIPPLEALEAACKLPPLAGRLRALRRDGLVVLDDCYNASPEAVLAALGVLEAFPPPRSAVLGELRELGPLTDEAYRAVAARLAPWLDELIVVGPGAAALAEAAREHGLPRERITEVSDTSSALQLVTSRSLTGTVLVKGAAALRLERVVAALVADAAVEREFSGPRRL